MLEVLDQRPGRLVASLLGRITALIRDHQDSKVALWRKPNDREVHGIAAGVSQNGAAAPVSLGSQPAKRIIAAKGRRVQSLVGGALQQSRFAAIAAQLIGDELRPVR